MGYRRLLTDTVSLVKANGARIDDIKASVQKTKVLIQRSDILIESGDFIERVMSNGAKESYEVIDPGFHEKFHTIPAGYQIDVRKQGLPKATHALQHHTYNISGSNNRVNQNSTDNSINVVNMESDLREHVEALRSTIASLNLSQEEQQSSYEVIDVVESQLISKTQSKPVVKALLAGLPHAASVSSICSLILACLGG